MAEDVEEILQEYYEEYIIQVEHIAIKQYLVIVKSRVNNNGFYFNYKWEDMYTMTANIDSIKETIKKMISKQNLI